eukprot:TRINITY_DN13197_c0_g1_i1.p1 TRINITY_DN13197_c0_g1~~TRINITY_DN13197_c0_g1_i1.p1  ORF type:complete len:228 (-),score=31.34 TRINITY_DN13197_c0_g1_i1:329-1012(-)
MAMAMKRGQANKCNSKNKCSFGADGMPADLKPGLVPPPQSRVHPTVCESDDMLEQEMRPRAHGLGQVQPLPRRALDLRTSTSMLSNEDAEWQKIVTALRKTSRVLASTSKAQAPLSDDELEWQRIVSVLRRESKENSIGRNANPAPSDPVCHNKNKMRFSGKKQIPTSQVEARPFFACNLQQVRGETQLMDSAFEDGMAGFVLVPPPPGLEMLGPPTLAHGVLTKVH